MKLTEAQRAGLQAAADNRSAWVAVKETYKRSGSRKAHRIAGRSASTTMAWLYRQGFIEFDHSTFPATVVLTDVGREALRGAAATKEGP